MVKRELDISSYMNYRVTSTLMVNPISCNFNPSDGVNTNQIINWDGDIPDYIVASETGDDINSRWFVIEAARKRGQQYELTLYRDTIVDYYESIKEADIFIEKAMIRDNDTSNPLLFNTENMSFNQIKYNDVKLYDKTKCPWLIGFISKDFKIDGEISIPSKNISSAVPNAFNVPSFAASEFSKNDGKWQVPPFQGIGNVGYEYVLTSPNTNNPGILSPMAWRYISTTYSAVQNGASVKYTDSSPFDSGGYSAILQTDMQTSELYNPNPKLGGKSRFEVYNNNSINWGNPYGLISIQLQDYLKKKYKVGLDSWFESYYYPNEILVYSEDTGKLYKGTRSTISAKEVIPTTFLETTDADALQLMNTIRNSFSTSIPDSTVEMKVNNISSTSFKIISNGEFYKYDFKEISAYNYTIDITQRDSLTDQPFDMFCMPYSDEFEYVNPQGNVIGTSSKDINLNIVQSISRQGKTTNSGIYDIQLVPYCPIINNVYEENGKPHISLDGISYTEIKQNEGSNVHTAGYIYWANKSKGSFNINYTIPDVLNASEKKVKSMTEFCRLTSPSQGSEFIFDPMKNNGVNSFLIQYYYKPYQSNIRIVPTWNQNSLYATSNIQNSQDGLIIMEDMSLSQVTDKWAQYELNNKNYRSAFQRQIQSMELDKNWSLGTGIANTLVGSVSGAAGGFMISGGNPIGAVVGGVASLGGGITDLIQQQVLKNDAIDLTKDNFNFMLGNIKALPLQLNKTSSFNPSNSLVPILEFWSATDKEKNIAENKIIFNGMTIGAIDNLYNYKTIGNAYFKGQLIRIQNINDDFHLVNTIAKELHQGIYLN